MSFEEWIAETYPDMAAAENYRSQKDRLHAAWNAALSLSAQEMPERPKPRKVIPRGGAFPLDYYDPAPVQAHFAKLEEIISSLRAQVEQPEQAGVRKALEAVKTMRLHDHELYISEDIYKMPAIENEANIPYSRAIRDVESKISALLPAGKEGKEAL